jgi:HlyD family secretion protein
MKNPRRFIPIILVAVLVVGGLAYWLVWWETRQPTNTLRLEGHLEATETDLAFKVSGLVQYIFFQEGDWVSKPQVVAGLEAKDLKDEVDRARAALAASKANWPNLRPVTPGSQGKEAEVARTRADLGNGVGLSALQSPTKKVVPAIAWDKFEAEYLMAKKSQECLNNTAC